jgi:hypothetical protein
MEEDFPHKIFGRTGDVSKFRSGGLFPIRGGRAGELAVNQT